MNAIIKKYFEDTVNEVKKIDKLHKQKELYEEMGKKLSPEWSYKLEDAFAELSHRLQVIEDAGLIEDYITYRMEEEV